MASTVICRDYGEFGSRRNLSGSNVISSRYHDGTRPRFVASPNEINAGTGKLIWKAAVGEHNGHDNDSLLVLEHGGTLKPPLTILPRSLGGVLTDLAVASGSVYAATIDLRLTFTNSKLPTVTKAAGPPTG